MIEGGVVTTMGLGSVPDGSVTSALEGALKKLPEPFEPLLEGGSCSEIESGCCCWLNCCTPGGGRGVELDTFASPS